MKRIKLEYGREIMITDEAFETISLIVMQSKLCGKCERPYTKDRPEVAENCCLDCFLRWHENQYLTFVGVWQSSSYGTSYQFLDPLGYIQLSNSSNPINQIDRSGYATIRYYGFPVPQTYSFNGKEQKLDPSCWSIYGDFRRNSVIVITYHQSYGNHLQVAFIVSKDGSETEINKRKHDIQRLLRRARERIEATKDEQGRYHVENFTTYQIFDSHLYSAVSDLLSAEYEQRIRSEDE